MTTEHWQKRKERGTRGWKIFIIAWARRCGRRPALILLYPIVAYFVLTAPVARKNIRKFYDRLFKRPSGWCDIYRNVYCFATTILDRVYFFTNRFDLFDVRIHELEVVHRLVSSGRGCLLVGTHLGSFEVLRMLVHRFGKVKLKILMNRNLNPQITDMLEALNPDVIDTVIDLSAPDSLIRAKACLDEGYAVALLGDRVVDDEDAVAVEFLGHPARLPSGPFKLAALLHVPVVLFFGLYLGKSRYDIYFEQLADEVVLTRGRRQADVVPYAQKFMRRIEYHLRLAPYNWFNFHDYWTD